MKGVEAPQAALHDVIDDVITNIINIIPSGLLLASSFWANFFAASYSRQMSSRFLATLRDVMLSMRMDGPSSCSHPFLIANVSELIWKRLIVLAIIPHAHAKYR
jgi:hypothetical protein